MASLQERRIHEALSSIQAEVIGRIVASNDGHFYLRIAISSQDGKQIPSNIALIKAKKTLEDEGIAVNFLLYDSATQDIEHGLRTTLLLLFNDHIRNAFITTEKCKVNIWFEQKNVQIDENILLQIEEKARVYLSNINLELNSISSLNSLNTPSKTAILNAVRIASPATIESISLLLRSNGFDIPSEDWIKRKIDVLRKSKHIIRLSNGSYALTLQTLKLLGSNVSRNSLDIQRFLALSRRSFI